MTVVLKKGEPKKEIQKKINSLQETSNQNKKIFTVLCGSLKGVFKEDAVILQRKLRNEWQ